MGWLAVFLMWFVLAPFVVLCVLAIPRVNPSAWLKTRDEGADYVRWLNVLFWNLNYWDSVSTLSGEVQNARVVMPKAMMTALGVTCLGYLLPLAVGIGITGME